MGSEISRSNENGVHNLRFRYHILFSVSIVLFILLWFITGLSFGSVTAYTDSYSLLYGMLITFLCIMGSYVPVSLKFRTAGFYMSGFVMINSLVLAMISINTQLMVFALTALVVSIADNLVYYSGFRKRLTRASIFIAVLILMAVLGNVFTLVAQPPGFPITFESLRDVMIGLGTKLPVMEYAGVMIISSRVDIIISPIEYFLFFAIAALVSENYYEIISYVVERNSMGTGISATAYGIVGALSCQCESAIALLPTMAVLIIDTVLLPIVFLSFALLLGTYILVTRFYKQGKGFPLKFKIRRRGSSRLYLMLSILTLAVVPLIILVGVYYSWQLSPLFFFPSGMLMTLSGYSLIFLIGRVFRSGRGNLTLNMAVIIGATILSLIWFVPRVTAYAYFNPSFYGLMSLSNFISGTLFGYAYARLGEQGKISLNEYITVLFGFIPVAVLYESEVLGLSIWSFFGLFGQIEFSLLAWIFMLPLMWVATHRGLSHISSVNRYVNIQIPVTPELAPNNQF